jgi:atypical dual specificity phosphatase
MRTDGWIKHWIGSAGNNFMDKFALKAPLSLVRMAGHVLFWPIAVSQHIMHRLGWFPWYSEIIKTPNGGRLLLGGLPWPNLIQSKLVLSENVSAVVNLVSEKKIDFKQPQRRIDIPMTDFVHPKESDVLLAVDFIDSCLKEGRTVYVHCRAGKGRSATVVMCWLVSRMNLDPVTAQEYMQSRRPQVLDNLKDREVVKQFYEKKKLDNTRTNS